MKRHSRRPARARLPGFTLIEVILAIGVFMVTILALVGLLGPALSSVEDIRKTSEVSSVVNSVNTFLSKSPEIANGGDSRFEAIYKSVADGNSATLFVFRAFPDNAGQGDEPIQKNTRLRIGFAPDSTAVSGDAEVADDDFANADDDFANAAGSIYRVVLTPSSVIPDEHRNDQGADAYPRYTLTKSSPTPDPNGGGGYPEGYFAMEARIFAESPPGPDATFDDSSDLDELGDTEPLFTYNTAIVR